MDALQRPEVQLLGLAGVLWLMGRRSRPEPSPEQIAARTVAELRAAGFDAERFVPDGESKKDAARRAALERAYPGRDVGGWDIWAWDPRLDGGQE